MLAFTPPHVLSGMPPNTPILLGLSGGADSVALFHLLCEYAKEYGTPLAVCHVEHGIRGEASMRDLAFCRQLAESRQIAFHGKSVNVPALAEKNKIGLEEQARRTRYAIFKTIMDEENIPLLATAHNATDNAETMLFRMARGTALSGLCGIPETRPFGEGLLIRPLLHTAKTEILDYCQENNLAYVTDATNDDVDYARNRIRHRILPELEAINAGAVRHMCELSESLKADEAYLAEQAALVLAEQERDGIDTKCLCSLPPPIAHRVLSLLFGKDLMLKNRQDIMALSENAVPHSRLYLPGGKIAVIEQGRLCRMEPTGFLPPLEETLPVTWGLTEMQGGNIAFLLDSEQTPSEKRKFIQNIYKNSTTTYIRFDTINGGLFARPRRAGDSLLSNGMHKKLRKLQGELGIEPALREHLPILCDEDGILFAPLVGTRESAAGHANDCRITLFWEKIV